jgi:hypothetical protein
MHERDSKISKQPPKKKKKQQETGFYPKIWTKLPSEAHEY